MNKKQLLLATLIMFIWSVPVFAEQDYVKFQNILNTTCSKCHSLVRVERAMQQSEDLTPIIEKMAQQGAVISETEQQVLGIFWKGHPAVPEQPQRSSAAADDPLNEYRAILEKRCSGCHSMDRVEAAMEQLRSLEELLEMMRQRGAIVTESEQKVLGVFWYDRPKKEQPQQK